MTRKERREKTTVAFKETGVYFAAMIGCFLSPYVQPFLEDDPITVVPSIQAAVGAVVGGVVAVAALRYWLDKGGAGEPAKQAKWKRRASMSFVVGLAINYVWAILVKVIERAA